MAIGTPVEVAGSPSASLAISTLAFPSASTGLVWVWSAAVPTGCSDPTNGTWTQRAQVTSSSRTLTLYSAAVIAGTPTITVTCGTANILEIMGSYVTGTAYDVAASQDDNFLGTSGAANAITAAPVTTTGLDTVLAIFANASTVNGTGVFTKDAAYTQLTTTFATTAGSTWLLEYLTQGAAGLITPPSTINGQCDVLTITVGVKPSAAGNGFTYAATSAITRAATQAVTNATP